MSFWLSGISIGDKPSISSLRESISVNTSVYSFYGQSKVQVDVTSLGSRSYDVSFLLERHNFDDPDEQEAIELLEENIQGLILRRGPIMIESDDHMLHGSSDKIFVYVHSANVNWRTGTTSTDMFAEVQLSCELIGTPGNLNGKFCTTVFHRPSHYEGEVASQSVVGLPTHLTSRSYSVAALETRNDTTMLNLGDPTTGFANDTVTALDGDAESGEVTFTGVGTNMFTNGVKVYDEGFSPRIRVTNKEHVFTGNMAVESELYRVLIDVSTPTDPLIEFYRGTGIGAYSGTAFESIRTAFFDVFSTSINQDEIVRISFNNGMHVELERGKDPVLRMPIGTTSFQCEVSTATASTVETSGSAVNYVQLGTNSYLSSQYGFDCVVGDVTQKDTAISDQVYSFIYYDSADWGGTSFADSRRFAEVLVEVSG